jgi:hypothetical protein
MKYRVTNQEISQILNDWEDEWKITEMETTQKDTENLEKEKQEIEKDQ